MLQGLVRDRLPKDHAGEMRVVLVCQVVAVIALASLRPSSAAENQLRLQVTLPVQSFELSDEVFMEDGPLMFMVILRNTSSKRIEVCAYDVGIISIVRVEHEGQLLRAHHRRVSFGEDPAAFYPQKMKILKPGATAAFKIQGLVSDNRAIRDEQYYVPEGRGTYAVTFQYAFSNGSMKQVAVSDPVSFSLH